ncbi:MAG: MGMT family protein [Patescibacteria group bacterium]|nr:MGMT family protein [Patescibacteria group bacterium]
METCNTKTHPKRNNLTSKVYSIVKKIPKGKVLTYKQVAMLAGSPNAFRAVGNVLNKNYNPEIPCHRVIKSNGQIGGYNKSVREKAKKLTKEGCKLTLK